TAVIFDLIHDQQIISNDQRIQLYLRITDAEPYIAENIHLFMPHFVEHPVILQLPSISRPIPLQLPLLPAVKLRPLSQYFQMHMAGRSSSVSNKHKFPP